jgi:pyridinium-3,5-biscarboxylic acid mononucleotide sulfurtransferase
MEHRQELLNSARTKLAALRTLLEGARPLLVAYSGGVDSSFLLAESVQALGDAALGILADSPSLPRSALIRALKTAKECGANVEIIKTTELDDPRYTRNPANRCYFCKLELFTRMQEIAIARGFATLAYGENADDAFQLRPGATAAREFRVLAPLREVGLTKSEIRLLSRERGLSTADLPAQPCLSSRIPHGTGVTRDALRMVEHAEEFVRACGFLVFRVRYIAQPGWAATAKLQVDASELDKLASVEGKIRSALREIGFHDLVVDPAGYQPPPKIVR